MPKIHFASLFGVDYELDLLYPWLSYYKNMEFDSYKIFLHREQGEIGSDVLRQFKMLGVDVERLGGPQGNGMLRKIVLGQYAASLPADDFLVTADADEFQSCPVANGHDHSGGTDYVKGVADPISPDYRKLFQKFDLVTGFMVDRYTLRLEAACGWPFAQYPFEEPFTKEYLKAFTPPYMRKTAWPHTRRTKILGGRCGYEIGYEGSHCALSLPSDVKITEDFRVYHFAWRESAKRKAVVKSYYNMENLEEIFGGVLPEEFRHDALREASDALGYQALEELPCVN